jgi:hypothetical protein
MLTLGKLKHRPSGIKLATCHQSVTCTHWLQDQEWDAPSIDEQVAALGELIREGKIK